MKMKRNAIQFEKAMSWYVKEANREEPQFGHKRNRI